MTRLLCAVCALGLGGALLAGCGGAGASGSTGTAVSHIDLSATKCGGDWKAQPDGRVDLAVTNRYSEVADVYAADSRTGEVYDELEGLAPKATAKIGATLAAGSYQLQCYTDTAGVNQARDAAVSRVHAAAYLEGAKLCAL